MLTKRYLWVVLSVFLLLASVVNACSYSNVHGLASSANLKDAVITLERTLCFGNCPAYKLTVYGNGAVTFEGKSFVRVTGKAEGAITQEQFKQLIFVFEEANYDSLKDSYTQISVTDAPYVTTSITVDGKTKTVRHYLGDPSAPPGLPHLKITLMRS